MSTNKNWIDQLLGKWIVVEGPDRIGKTTLINNFTSYLLSNGISKEDIVTIAFPQRQFHIGAILDKHLKNEISLTNRVQVLLFLADMEQAFTTINEALQQNKVVICDRYTASTYSYARAQQNNNDDKDVNYLWLESAIELVRKPYLFVFLLYKEDEDIEYAFRRASFGIERTETQEIQREVVSYMKDYAYNLVAMKNRLVLSISHDDTPTIVLKKLISGLELR